MAHKVARAHIDRMDAEFRAGFPLSSSPPYSSPTFEVVVGALRGAAVFATVFVYDSNFSPTPTPNPNPDY